MSTNLAILDGLKILMEVVDDMHDALENIISTSKKYEERLLPLNNPDIFNEDSVTRVLNEMSPERASAMATALMDLSEFAPANDQDGKKAMGMLEDLIQRTKTIRANLHAALDEKS